MWGFSVLCSSPPSLSSVPWCFAPAVEVHVCPSPCMCEDTCVWVHVCVRWGIHVAARGWCQIISWLTSSPQFWDRLLLTMELTNWLDWLTGKTQETFCLYFPLDEILVCTFLPGFLQGLECSPHACTTCALPSPSPSCSSETAVSLLTVSSFLKVVYI